jgi:predicted transcriptional regulator
MVRLNIGPDMRDDNRSDEDILKLVTEIVTAYVSRNNVAAEDLPNVIKSVHATLGGIQGSDATTLSRAPAVPVKKSVTPDYIVCLEDGKKLKMLKRYLRAQYGLTPEAYRAKWNLPADYPMTAPNYAARRSEFAKQIGLGKPRKKRA